MFNSDANQPQVNRKASLIGLFAASTAYALLLNTKWGKRWADEQTWVTVVAGTAMTTAFVALEDRKAASMTLLYFAVSGIPIILRSLWLQLERMESALDKLTGTR